MPGEAERWNHNTHYHSVIYGAVAHVRGNVLDVGCGEGTLARGLCRRGLAVTAIDIDEASIEAGRQQSRGCAIDFIRGEFLARAFAPQSFEAIVSVAALHHMNMAAALDKMRSLLRPGGTLAIIGLARSKLPWDLPLDVAGVVATRLLRIRKGYWHHGSPLVWPPPLTFGEARRVAEDRLPGARFHRRLLWRFTLTWTKPTATGAT